jgi:hypothetical protein
VDLTADLSGVSRLAASSGAAGNALADLSEVNAAAGDLVLGAAVIPRATGALASTVHVVATAFGVEVVAGGPLAPYAPAVHAANPFLTDALSARVEEIADHYLDHAERVVATIGA